MTFGELIPFHQWLRASPSLPSPPHWVFFFGVNGPKAFDPIGPERAGPALATVEACKLTVTVSEREVQKRRWGEAMPSPPRGLRDG